jgi:hypothetical protein
VLNQGVRLVLREHAHAADAAVHAVRQREVDDAKLAAEGHGRFGPPVGKVLQPRAAAPGQDQRQGVAGQTADETFGVHETHSALLDSLDLLLMAALVCRCF